MTAPFRALENTHSQSRKDQIVTAAVSSFVARTRPTKLEANLLEDLVLPIIPYTEPATRRLAAACMSHSAHVPHRLVMRLCEEEAEICAALLLCSPVLKDEDLVSLIERRGMAFARVIARRTDISGKLRNFLLVLGDESVATAVFADKTSLPVLHPAIAANPIEISEKLEAARSALREMMRGKTVAAAPEPLPAPVETAKPKPEYGNTAAKLRATALLADDSFFITGLADTHGLTFERSRRILQRSAPSELMTALHAAGVLTADAFIICAAFFPVIVREKTEITLFLTRYEKLVREQSQGNVRQWKAEEASATLRAGPANSSMPEAVALKAS